MSQMRPLQTYADPNATATIEIEQDDGVPVAILQIADNSLRTIVDTSREHHGRREQPCHIEVGFEDPAEANYWSDVINDAYGHDEETGNAGIEQEIWDLERYIKAAEAGLMSDTLGRNAKAQCTALFDTVDEDKVGSVSRGMAATGACIGSAGAPLEPARPFQSQHTEPRWSGCLQSSISDSRVTLS